jgi:hypothetical protein
MCFLPGPFLLDYLAKLGKIRISNTERVLLGCVVWNFGWVSAAYIVAILTSSIGAFYWLSLGIGAAIILLDVYETARCRPRVRLPHFDFDYALAFALIGVLGALIAIEIMAHTIYSEYDPLFYYLPLTKSIVLTGGLRFDPLHATGLTTTMPPALPLMYGSVLFFSGSLSEFDAAVRIIPLLYIILTSLGVHALSSEIFEDSNLALASTICFLSLPVLMSMALNYTLYLDLGLVFVTTVAMYLVVRVGGHQDNDSFRWLVLGASFGLVMLVKDTAYFIVPSMFILVTMPRLWGLGRNKAALLVAFVFTGTYTFFFVIDVLFLSEFGIVVAQTTILGVSVLAFLILRRTELSRLHAPSRRQVLLLISPSASAVVFFFRNLLEYRVVSFDLIWFNTAALHANQLITQAVNPSIVAPNFQNLLEIFVSYDAGFTLILPLVLGILGLLVAHKTHPEKWLIFLLFWLMLIALWGWVFSFSYIGNALRWVYEFAPILALLAAAGMGFVSRAWRFHNSIVIRLVLFESLALLYLWTGPLNIGASGIISLSGRFEFISPTTLQSLLVLSVFFVIAFIPIRFVNSNRSRGSGRVGRCIVTGAFLLLLVFPVYSFASETLGSAQTTAASPAPGWENNLSEVISYVNANLKDNYTIMTFYAMPIAYFTNHSIVEMWSWYGVASVLGLVGVNESTALGALVRDGIRYLLIPTPANSQYQYYLHLADNFTFLNPQALSTNPELTLLASFQDYQLYRVLD